MPPESNTDSKSRDRKFTLFPQLPPELRAQIWSHSLDHPRIILLRPKRVIYRPPHQLSHNHRSSGTSLFKSLHLPPCRIYEKGCLSEYRSPCRPPIILSVCHESRTIGSQFYSKTFAGPATPAETWIDFSRDILYVYAHDIHQDQSSFYSDLEKDIKKVKHLALRCSGLWAMQDILDNWLNWNVFNIYYALVAFTDLERIMFVDYQHTICRDLPIAVDHPPYVAPAIVNEEQVKKELLRFEQRETPLTHVRAAVPIGLEGLTLPAQLPRFEFRDFGQDPKRERVEQCVIEEERKESKGQIDEGKTRSFWKERLRSLFFPSSR